MLQEKNLENCRNDRSVYDIRKQLYTCFKNIYQYVHLVPYFSKMPNFLLCLSFRIAFLNIFTRILFITFCVFPATRVIMDKMRNKYLSVLLDN